MRLVETPVVDGTPEAAKPPHVFGLAGRSHLEGAGTPRLAVLPAPVDEGEETEQVDGIGHGAEP